MKNQTQKEMHIIKLPTPIILPIVGNIWERPCLFIRNLFPKMGRKHLFHFLAQMFVVFLTEFNFLRIFHHRCFPYCTVGFIDAMSHASICSPIRQHVTNLQLCHQRVFVYLHINAALQLERLFWEIFAIWTSITSKK